MSASFHAVSGSFEWHESFQTLRKAWDIVYSLPAIRELGGGKIVLNPNKLVGLSPDAALSLLPLLRGQPYIEDAQIWRGEAVHFDLDKFREELGYFNLVISHLLAFDMSLDALAFPWITVSGAQHGRPVFARSLLRHNLNDLWQVCQKLLPSPLFVGTSEEHAQFEKEFGEIEWQKTKDLLELAEVIGGCSVFVGNQSCCFAIAEGLKVRSVLEVDPVSPNCNFGRAEGLQVTHKNDLEWVAPIIKQWGES